MIKPKRGDIFWIRKGLSYGSEMRSGRPAIVVSNDTANRFSPDVEVVYLTTKQKKELPTHCTVKTTSLCTAICEQVTTVSKERLGDFIRCCTDSEMKEIDKCLMISLGLKNDEGQNVQVVQEDVQTVPDVQVADKELEMARITAERDTFKKLYEDLLERMMK